MVLVESIYYYLTNHFYGTSWTYILLLDIICISPFLFPLVFTLPHSYCFSSPTSLHHHRATAKLPPPSCHRQAATTTAPPPSCRRQELPPPSCRRRRAEHRRCAAANASAPPPSCRRQAVAAKLPLPSSCRPHLAERRHRAAAAAAAAPPPSCCRQAVATKLPPPLRQCQAAAAVALHADQLRVEQVVIK